MRKLLVLIAVCCLWAAPLRAAGLEGTIWSAGGGVYHAFFAQGVWFGDAARPADGWLPIMLYLAGEERFVAWNLRHWPPAWFMLCGRYDRGGEELWCRPHGSPAGRLLIMPWNPVGAMQWRLYADRFLPEKTPVPRQ